MRTTIDLDDHLIEQAQWLTGVNEPTALVREGLRALIERSHARRLARLGGTEPELNVPPRSHCLEIAAGAISRSVA